MSNPFGITGSQRRWFVRSLPNVDAQKLRFLQWNTLSADLVEGFQTVDFSTWTSEHREELFERQILEVAPDIVCLQEVNASGDCLCIQSIAKRLSHHLQLACYVPKKHKRDGVAIFYRPQKLRLLSTVAIPLYTEESESQVACLATFEYCSELESSFIFHVISTHLKAKRENLEKRSRQVDCLLDTLKHWNMVNETCLVILCGDLNAEPNEVAISKLRSCGFEWIYQQMSINDPILYSSSKKRDNEEHPISMLDYIFFKSSSQYSITCEACLLPPLIHSEQDAVFIPNQEYPSDHWDIVSDLLFTKRVQHE